MKALIDGDVVVYRCAFAAQHYLYKYFLEGDPFKEIVAEFRYKKEANEWLKAREQNYIEIKELVVEPVRNCLHSVKTHISQILADTKADDYLIYLSGEGNFREEVDSNYKLTRKKSLNRSII